MIARRELPAGHVAWNRKWGAPFGNRWPRRLRRIPMIGEWAGRTLPEWAPSALGPFGFQPNSVVRTAEYPWAFEAGRLSPGLHVLDIGGGCGGFQFVAAKGGCHVVNVDPGMEANGRGWPVDAATIAKLNRAFGTDVVLHNCFLAQAPVAPASFDRVFSLSVIEHIPRDEVAGIMESVYGLLKPGGLCVITLDLFLNLRPFCSRETNEFGTYIPARTLVEAAPFELVAGDRRELSGFPEFSTDDILSRLDEFFVGDYPALAQLMVLKKPG